MPANSSKGRVTPAEPETFTETALPKMAPGQALATTLSGAFAAALGARPQIGHPERSLPQGTGRKPTANEAGGPRIRNSKFGAPSVPRKGHR